MKYMRQIMQKVPKKEMEIRDNNVLRGPRIQYFYKSNKIKQETKGKLPEMEKFVTFCTGKKLDESTTSHKEGTETV